MKDVKPDIRSYCIVLNCLANSRSRDAANEAEAVLELMISRYKAGDESIKPNIISFSTVINAFAKSRDSDTATKADYVFDRMQAFGVRPNRRTFNSLISAWANSRDPRAAEKAEGYLSEMKRLHEGGDETCRPDTITFNAVMNAWAMSKDPNAPAKAQRLLDEMKQRDIAGDNGCRPDLITYNSLFKVLSRSKAKGKALLAEELFYEMYDRSIQPDDRTFRAVLMVCAFSKSYNLASRKRAFKIATDVMQRAYVETSPSKETFNFFFRAAEELGPSEEVEKVYKWCCEAGFGDDQSIQQDLKNIATNLQKARTNEPADIALEAKPTLHLCTSPSECQSCLKTDFLLASETGTWSSEEWDEAILAMRHWKVKGTSEGMETAWKLLDRCIHEERKGNDVAAATSVRLERRFVHALVHSWNQTPNEVPARDVLNKVQLFRSLSPDDYPDILLYTMIIDNAIKRGDDDAHDLAEKALQSLVESSQKHNSVRPDTSIFNRAFYALSKSGASDAPQRAEALLQQMRDLTTKGWDNVNPNVKTYNCLISTWANSRQPGAGRRAEELLMESPEPNSRSFCAVMDAWSKSDDPGAADACLELFQHMKTLYACGCCENVKPTQIVYGTVISALARKGRANEAETVMRELLNEYERTMDPDLAPDRVQFNALIDAWAKCREKGAAERAEVLLENMTKLASKAKNNDFLPDVISYNSVLNAWAKSTDPSAASRAEAILRRMHEVEKTGVPGVKPNVRSYNIVLDCLANSKRDAVGRAEALLDVMLHRCQAGEGDLRPNIISFNSVLNAFAKSRDPDSASKADALFGRMRAFGTMPDTRTFNSLISTWTNSRDPRAAEKAEAYLNEMKRLFERGYKSCKPNAIVYNAVLNSWSTSRDPMASEKARRFYDEMKSLAEGGDRDCRPNVITYNSLLNVVGKSFAEDKAVVAWNLLSEMDERGIKPNDRTFGSVLMACAFSNAFDLATRERAFQIAGKTFQRAFCRDEAVEGYFSLLLQSSERIGV